MKILVITAHDAVNLSVENVIREFMKRGHEVDIYALRMEKRHIRMFENLNVSLQPVSQLSKEDVQKYDCAFCPMDAVSSLMFYNIYIFSYNFIFSNRWPTIGGDFMFMQTENRPILQWEDSARMAVGSPKNDTPFLSQNAQNETILFIDTGHYPFGKTGKEELANMLLSICDRFPDEEIIVKPRWLPTESNDIHTNKIHLYNVIQEACDYKIPSNLILLNEHIDMQYLIDQSKVVITPGSSTYLEAAMRGKNILIVTGLTSENSYEIRTDTVWKEQFQIFSESGCLVDYREVENYLPNGLKCRKEHLVKMGATLKNVSKEIVDVVENVFLKFLSKGLFPEIKQYSLEDYATSMRADKDISYTELKYKRMKNRTLVMARQFDYVVADINYEKWLNQLNSIYQNYSVNPSGRNTLWDDMKKTLADIWIDESDKLLQDDIDQSILLQTLYDTKRIDKILALPVENILCKGPYHYYLGKIYGEERATLSAMESYVVFLKEANSRSFKKYPQEADWGIRNAYNYLFAYYNGQNIAPEDFADLYIDFYKQRKMTIVSYPNRKRAHNMLPKVAEQLAETDPERALKCLQLYAQWEYHYNIRERDNQLKEIRNSKFYHFGRAVKFTVKKIKGGVRCLQEHGWKYTAHRTWEHIQNLLREQKMFKMISVFSKQIMGGYAIYAELIMEAQDNAFIHIAAGGNGDVYLILQYYREYIEKYFPDKKNILVSDSSSFSQLTNWWKIDNERQLSVTQWQNLIHLYVFSTSVNIDILHPHIFLRHTGILAYLEGIHGLNFMELQNAVLFENLLPEKPLLHDDFLKLATVFSKNELIQRKTVVLSPYAQSLPTVPGTYWTKLVEALKEQGMSVCTNAFGAQLPVLGTVKIELPFCELEHFLDMAGYCVSLRSGFDDITHNSTCRRVEVYAEKTVKRSLVVSTIECFAYSEHPIIVSSKNIDACVEETLIQLGLDKRGKKERLRNEL